MKTRTEAIAVLKADIAEMETIGYSEKASVFDSFFEDKGAAMRAETSIAIGNGTFEPLNAAKGRLSQLEAMTDEDYRLEGEQADEYLLKMEIAHMTNR